MQLCEFCTQYNTCQLDKRVKQKLFDPCPAPPFELIEDLPQDRYEAIKAQLLRVRENARGQSKTVINLDIPMELTENELLEGPLPRLLYFDFLKLDLNETEQIVEFLFRDEHAALLNMLASYGFIQKEVPSSEDAETGKGAGVLILKQKPDHSWIRDFKKQGLADPIAPWFRRDLKAVQEDLRAMVERWTDDPEGFGSASWPFREDIQREKYIDVKDNPPGPGSKYDIVARVYSGVRFLTAPDTLRVDAWFRHTLGFGIDWIRGFNEGVTKLQAEIDHDYWYGILYYLFLSDVVEKQEFKRCRVCKSLFRPKRSGPSGSTCGEPKCRTAMSRYPERYGMKV